jgi:predicted dehydrogenase
MRRRKFLSRLSKSSLVLTLPTIIPSALYSQNNLTTPSNRIVMAVIGTGVMGTSNLRGFLGKKEVQIIAVCDVDLRHAMEAKEIVDGKYNNSDCKIYQDFLELLENEELDAVVHAVPDHWHGVVAISAIKRGLHVYGEKPLARTLKESQAIATAVKKYKVVWQTGSQQRSSALFRLATELVRNGRIGEVTYAEVGIPGNGQPRVIPPRLLPIPSELNWDLWLGPSPKRPYMDFGNGDCHRSWRSLMDFSGGTLTDWAGHHIDCAHWGLDFDYTGPIQVEGKGQYNREGIYDVPYAFQFECTYKNGVKMMVADEGKTTHGIGVTFFGKMGWIYVDRAGIWANPTKVLKERIGPYEIQLYHSNDHRQNFLDCIRRGNIRTAAPVEIGHRSISVAFLGEITMLLGRKIDWDPENEKFLGDPEAEKLLSRPMRPPWTL